MGKVRRIMNVEIANKLVKLRKNRGLSQEALADKLGVSRQAVSKWERAESSPDTDNLISLSRLYDVSIDDMLNGQIDEMDNAEDAKRKRLIKHKHDAWGAIGSVIAIIIFISTGLIYGAWAVNWLAFLLIPIFYYIPIITMKK